MIRSILTLLCVCIAAVATLPATAAPKKRLTKKEKAEKQLREFYLSLDRRLFGEKDYKEADKLLKKSTKDDIMRPLLVSLLAQYQRRMERDPIAALGTLAPEVLGKDKGKLWARNLRTAQQKAEVKYGKQVLLAKRRGQPVPPKPSSLALAFPRKQMTITHSNVDCALEVARCLMELNEIQEALAIIDSQGKTFEREGRVLAFECLGDLTVKLSMLKKAAGAYNNGLGLMKQLRPTEGHDEWHKRIIARIQRKLGQVKRLLEIEKYGKGYVLYREAENRRLKSKAYGEAILIYDRILAEFPKTIYGEAARAYKIRCRLELAEHNSRPKALRKVVEYWQKKIADEEAFIKLAKKHKVPKASLAAFESEKAKLVDGLNQAKAVPFGKKSLELAKEETRAFVKANLYGCYRGEVLVAVANYAFARELDPEQADKYFRQAWGWLSKVEEIDKTIQTYQIPKKAAKVAAPTQVAVKKDFWGNIDRQSQRVGAIVNRRTCKWYLNDLRAKTVMAIGFLCFYEKKNKEAIEWYKKTLTYDEKTRALAKQGQWNDYKRLKWGAEHGYLFAYPDELKNFHKQQRFAVLLADFYFCTDRYAQAQSICNRLGKGEFGKNNGKATDYLLYLRAASISRLDGRDKAMDAYAQVFAKIDHTFTEDRAMFCYGKVVGRSRKTVAKERGLSVLKRLADKSRKNEFVMKARIEYGRILIDAGRSREGIRYLRDRIPESSDYKGIANFMIEHYQKEGKLGRDL